MLGIHIHRDHSQDTLTLSQKRYIEKALKKGDKYSPNQCPKNELEKKEMQGISYTLIVGSLMLRFLCICILCTLLLYRVDI